MIKESMTMTSTGDGCVESEVSGSKWPMVLPPGFFSGGVCLKDFCPAADEKPEAGRRRTVARSVTVVFCEWEL